MGLVMCAYKMVVLVAWVLCFSACGRNHPDSETSDPISVRAPDVETEAVRVEPKWEEPTEPVNDPWDGIPPQGFALTDAYKTIQDACNGEADYVDFPNGRAKFEAIRWCLHRGYHSTRFKTIKSVVDGSQIHDRDRPTAWMFYTKAVADGVLWPHHCKWHAAEKAGHPSGCYNLAKKWPYKNPGLTDQTKQTWLHQSHDFERFGARGPIDNNANAYRYLAGCWDPKQLERNDVAARVTLQHVAHICKKYKCGNKEQIKEHW